MMFVVTMSFHLSSIKSLCVCVCSGGSRISFVGGAKGGLNSSEGGLKN